MAKSKAKELLTGENAWFAYIFIIPVILYYALTFPSTPEEQEAFKEKVDICKGLPMRFESVTSATRKGGFCRVTCRDETAILLKLVNIHKFPYSFKDAEMACH